MIPFRTVPDEDAESLGPEEAFEMLMASALGLKDVAARLGISLRQVQAHVDDGSLIAVNVGRGDVRRDLRVLEEDLEGFLKRRRTSAARAATFQDVGDARPKPLGSNPSFSARRAARKARQAGAAR